MSLRVLFCLLFVLGFSWYAYRNWFVSLCASVFLMAFLKHPDMPRSLGGIPGFNMWNVLIVNVIIAWWMQRRYEEPVAPTTPSLKVAVVLYFVVVTISFLRAYIDPGVYYKGTRMDILLNFFVDAFRFLIPAFLFYDGCRTRERVQGALMAIVLLYFLLSVQVIRYMGVNPDFSGNELSGRGSRIIQRSIGYDRVDMSMMLSGASWAALAASMLFEKKYMRWGLRAMALPIMFGQALTGGRTGYVTWGVVGLILCTIRWRKMLPRIPVAAVVVVTLMPSVRDRMFSGFGGQTGAIVVHQDASAITSGRNLMWPEVIRRIEQQPIFGYGRIATIRIGLAKWARDVLQDTFDHPHEAYLEMLLDTGIAGFLCVIPVYFLAVKRSGGLFLDRSDLVYEAAGSTALALVLALLFASFGAQTLYPRESVVGMWAAVGVAWRVWAERSNRGQFEHSQGEELVEDTEPEIIIESDPAMV